MTHIASCLLDPPRGVGLSNYNTRELSPQRLQDEVRVCQLVFENLVAHHVLNYSGGSTGLKVPWLSWIYVIKVENMLGVENAKCMLFPILAIQVKSTPPCLVMRCKIVT